MWRMPEIELKPTEYRLKGVARLRRKLPDAWWGRIATIAGIWAGTLVCIGGYILDGLPHLAPIWIIVAAFGPGVLLWLYAAFFTD